MITERRRVSGPVLGVLFVAGLTAMAFAQTPPALPEPKSPSPQIPEKIAPPLNSPGAHAPRGRLRLTSEQLQVIRRDLAPEGSAIHTQVQLGERVPADVSLLPMPAAVLSDIPIVDSYLYFVTDEDVVLVAPDTREVVELIPKLDASGGMIKPPPGVYPQIVKPAPVPEPNSTPVIPPPGMPGGPPGPEPK